MADNDTFTAGVEFGGLRTRQEIKVLICFLLESLDKPLSKEQLNEIMQTQGIANYFEVNQALEELIEGGTAEVKDGELLMLTEKGRDATPVLENDLPKTVREKALNAAINLQTKARRARENKIEVEKLDIGYNVTFTIFDKEDVLMRLTVYVADFAQVETVKQGFLNDPVSLYSGIIAALST